MQIYSYKFDRVIWLTTTPTEIRPDLQDLPGNFEYERTASISNVKAVCKALKVSDNEVEAKLFLLLENQKTAFWYLHSIIRLSQNSLSLFFRKQMI